MKKRFFLLFLISFFAETVQSQVPELWGMTTTGGTNSSGTIFKINGDGTGFNSVFSFDVNSGSGPRGSLCLAPNGKLYGATNGGGTQGVGTLFCFNPTGNVFTKIVDFNYSNGAYPWGSLTLAGNGFLYGTSYGGANGDGNIFRVNPANNSFSPLYNLWSGDGASPGGRMVEASNGLLYGMTAYSGANSGGTIFSFNPNGNVYTNVHDFTTAGGKTGYGSLLEASDSNLYGMTRNGGTYGVGALFRFEPASNIYTKLMDFDTANGKWPWNGLIQVGGSKIYGMTANGGAFNIGVIFSYDFVSGIYTLEHSFDITNGSVPFGSLFEASDSYLYGMTFNGGNNLLGTAFRFDPLTDSLTLIHSFNGTDGSSPSGDFVEIVQPSIVQETNDGPRFNVYPNPSDGLVTITGNVPGNASGSLQITNMQGQVLKENEIHSLNNFFSMQYDLSKMPCGIYFLKIKSGAGLLVKKLVKE